MPSGTLESGFSRGAKSDDLGRFCASMAEGLHAMAQPLTILRSTVAASAAPGVSEVSQRRYLELSTQQLERACGLFECLQDLVIASKIEADCAPIELSELLAPVIEDRRAELQRSGIEFRVVAPSGPLPVVGDLARTLQALFAALKIAASVSLPGDAIELAVTMRDGFVAMTVQNRRLHGRNLNSSERLSLALAEANTRSQRGEFECVDDPLCVSLALPSRDVDP